MEVNQLIKKLYERNPLSSKVVKLIGKLSEELKHVNIHIMDFCGTHEWTVTHYGIRFLMPRNIDLIAGPGCPVCITPAYYVDELIKLSFEGIHVLTFGDSFKLPGTSSNKIRSLEHSKSLGGSVDVVYSVFDAIKLAKRNQFKEYVFFAVGFETTAPSTASPLSRGVVPKNLKFLIAHRLTPPVVEYLFTKVPSITINGVIAPGHVSTIIGASAWGFIPKDYKVSTVVAGFEPLDVLLAIYLILRDYLLKKPELHNEYVRAVKFEGNVRAKKVLKEVFDITDAAWRGIGTIPNSGYVLKDKFKEFDAAVQYGIKDVRNIANEFPKGCKCGEVVLGKSKPIECPFFMKACTPQTPYGPCMVSVEGTCRIWAEHGGYFLLKDWKIKL